MLSIYFIYIFHYYPCKFYHYWVIIKVKVSKNQKKMKFILQKSIFHIFFMEFAFWEEHFITLHFLSWFILSYMIFYDIFVFFYFIQKKYIFIKYFFTINLPINYPPLSKKYLKLSKNCPFFQIRSQKIRKKLKKSRKNPIFSLFFLWSQWSFDKKLYYHLSCKIMKKNVIIF